MRSKSKDLMNNIITYIDKVYCLKGRTPTMQDIADYFHITKGSVSNYIKEMDHTGLIENRGGSRGIVTKTMQKTMKTQSLAIIGHIACGQPLLAEENIQGYLSISSEFLGGGQFFVLEAEGDSMIDAGINNGDYVVVRKQESAEEGQIVVALIEDEATLKRYYVDKKKKKIRLHPENREMEDMYFDSIQIQGVAVKVIKNLD